MATFEIQTGDITAIDADVIVTAANNALSGGGGVDRAVHMGAGAGLKEACEALGRCPTGQAVMTPGFSLKATWIVHAVGPVWDGGEKGEAALLENA